MRIGLFLISSFKDLQFGWLNYIKFIFSNFSAQRTSTFSAGSMEATTNGNGPREPFSPMSTGTAIPGTIYFKAADIIAATSTNPKNQILASRPTSVPPNTAVASTSAVMSAAPAVSQAGSSHNQAEDVQRRKKSKTERLKHFFRISDLHRFGSKKKSHKQHQQGAIKNGADGNKTNGSPLESPRGPEAISIGPTGSVRFTHHPASPRLLPRNLQPHEGPAGLSSESPPSYYENMYRPPAAPSSVAGNAPVPVPGAASPISSPRRQPNVNFRMLLNSQQQPPSGFSSNPSTHVSTPDAGGNFRGFPGSRSPPQSARTGYSSSQNEAMPLLQQQPPDEQSDVPETEAGAGGRQQPLNSTASSDASHNNRELAGESSALATLTTASGASHPETLLQSGEADPNARPLSGESEISQDLEEQLQPPDEQRYAPRARALSEESDPQNYYSNQEFVKSRQQPQQPSASASAPAPRPPPAPAPVPPVPRNPPPARHPDQSRLIMDTDLDDTLEASDSFYMNARRPPPPPPSAPHSTHHVAHV